MHSDARDLIVKLLNEVVVAAEHISMVGIFLADAEAPELATLLEDMQRQLARSNTLAAAALALFDQYGTAAPPHL